MSTDSYSFPYDKPEEETGFPGENISEMVHSSNSYILQARSAPIIHSSEYEKEEFSLTPAKLKEHLLNPSIKVKIAPLLLITGGLPNSSKTTALKELMHHVDKDTSVLKEKDGIGFSEVFAARNFIKDSILLAPRGRNKGYPSVLYAGMESMIRSRGKRLTNVDLKTQVDVQIAPLDSSGASSEFSNPDLDEYLRTILKNMHQDNLQKEYHGLTEWDQSHTSGLALVNVWDLGLNKVPTYLLSRLAGHLYNSHVWMFLDLLRDVDHLYEVPDIPDNQDESRNDKELIMRWHSRIRYFLHFAKLASKENENRQKACSIIATLKRSTKTKEKVDKLKEVMSTVSKQLKLDELIDIENIHEFRVFDKLQGIKPLKMLFEGWMADELKQATDVPLSFIFLRGMFYGKNLLYIQREELEKIALEELKMSSEMLKEFCCLFTSFGSIIDVSLIDSKSTLIILQPVPFLNRFDKLFYYEGGDALVKKSGLISNTTLSEVFEAQDDPIYISFLKSLHMAIDLPCNQVPVQGSSIYYVPNLCTSPPLLQCTPTSLHLVHDMNTTISHFKVLFISKFLSHYNSTQIHDFSHTNVTRFHPPSLPIFELVYLGDIIEFRFPDERKNLNEICEHIISVCHEIMKGIKSKIKYNFAVMCSRDKQLNPCKIQTRRHLLPFDCKSCSAKCFEDISDVNAAKISTFNAVIEKKPVDKEQMLNGEPILLDDAANISRTLSSLSDEGAQAVYKAFTANGINAEGKKDWKLFMRMILDWECTQENDSKRDFALKLQSIAEHLKSDSDALLDLARNFLRGSYLSSRK